MQYGIYVPSVVKQSCGWRSNACQEDGRKYSCKEQIEMPIITTPPHDATYFNCRTGIPVFIQTKQILKPRLLLPINFDLFYLFIVASRKHAINA